MWPSATCAATRCAATAPPASAPPTWSTGGSREFPRHAHDQTLDTAATLGLPGVALLWVAGVCGLGGLVVAARRAGPDGALAAAGFAAALGGVLHAHVERLWLAPVIGLPLAALLGAGAALLTRRG